jgi:hypothetical protein
LNHLHYIHNPADKDLFQAIEGLGSRKVVKHSPVIAQLRYFVLLSMIGKVLDRSIAIQFGKIVDIVVIPDIGLCSFFQVLLLFHNGMDG